MSDEEAKIPFTSHLEELRKRLITCFIAIGVGFVLAYSLKEWLFHLLTAPLISVMQPGEKLIFTSLPEAFFVYLKVAFLSGTLLAIPVILYQFWMFIAPGLYTDERRHLAPIMVLSIFFFIAGALFGYFVVFPIGFEFFLSFATDTIRPLLTMREFLSFASLFLLAFGLMFELPLVLVFLDRKSVV
jgi:sec-independent protein translocase protein TatC